MTAAQRNAGFLPLGYFTCTAGSATDLSGAGPWNLSRVTCWEMFRSPNATSSAPRV